jgi:hypothetical protein
MEDVWASRADEGRGILRKATVRRMQPHELSVSEWGNPAGEEPVTASAEGTGGTETSKYPEEKRGFCE